MREVCKKSKPQVHEKTQSPQCKEKFVKMQSPQYRGKDRKVCKNSKPSMHGKTRKKQSLQYRGES